MATAEGRSKMRFRRFYGGYYEFAGGYIRRHSEPDASGNRWYVHYADHNFVTCKTLREAKQHAAEYGARLVCLLGEN